MFGQSIEEQKIKIPFVAGFLYPIRKISERFKEFLFLTGFISLIFSVVKIMIGQNFFCGILKDVFCSMSLFSVILSLLVFFIGIGFYVNRLMCIVFDGVCFKEAIKTKCFKQDIRAVLFAVLYFFLWMVACLGIYFLNERVPVDSWKIELTIFVAVSAVIILAVVLLTNFVIFFRFLQKKNVFVLQQTFWPIFDNIFKLSAWFLFYFLIFFVLLKIVFFYFLLSNLPIWIKVFGNEFCFNFVIFSVVAVWILHLNYLSECLFGEKK